MFAHVRMSARLGTHVRVRMTVRVNVGARENDCGHVKEMCANKFVVACECSRVEICARVYRCGRVQACARV